ncbi:beta-glucosidase BglX [Lutibacter sp. B1]|uniref:beta-glucosidase BglX n=1 Tax=Lutibacter sp. B1 TaxID=2725996 RepID=UPI001456AB23|nr:beta-glucosidase BglX [Lutibacter sp. B1]NLP58944.1 beta-glucosidase BglX [Lutibacter sp. B1]
MKIKKLILFFSLSVFFGVLGCKKDSIQNENNVLLNNKNVKMESFLDSLMQVMTLDEKIGQMVLFSTDWEKTGPSINNSYKKLVEEGKVGNIFNAYTSKFTRELQKTAIENTRLGIPLLFGYDVIHGHRTIFPISLGESASWDLEAIENGARIAAIEAAAEGIHWTFAPMVDIARDPRWGRVSEGAGEDVYLGSEIAKARVRGFQGDDLSATNTILACAKHYAAYGAAQGGRDYNTVDISERELRTTYLPPFKATVNEGVATFMTSFNELNGVPVTGNKYLLTDILKTEWGFKGFVVTDYTSINEMVAHGIVKDDKEAAELAVNAGVDMDMQGAAFMDYLKELIAEGKVSEKKVDESVRSILALKYQLGLFDDPYKYCDEEREKNSLMTTENLEAARDMARKSSVLLKNNKEILPISKDKKIALIGPLADNKWDIIGSWSAAGDRYEKPVTVLEGFKTKISNSSNLMFAKGCEINSDDTKGFNEAIAIAKKADVIVMVMGESQDMSGESASRTNLDLPGNQKDLLKEIKKTGKPIVLVLMNGRPLTLEWENEHIDAILETWFPGTMGGIAIADLIFGDYNPSGKLTMSFPRNVGQIPIYYNVKNTGRPIDPKNPYEKYKSNYLDVLNSPLYPFGYGLSYTTFEYSDLSIDKNKFTFNEDITVSVIIKNTGKYKGEEVAQLYVQDLVGSVTRPLKELKRFEKILLNPGESKEVSFTINSKDLAFYTRDMSFKAEPGEFKIYVGTNSQNVLETQFSLK